jgi:hypothetical protein
VKEKTPLGADLVIPALALAFAAYFFVSIADLAWEAKANGTVIGGILVLLVLVHLARIGLRVYRRTGNFGFAPLLAPRDALGKRVGLVLITLVFVATLKWLGLTLGLLLALFASLWIMGARGKALYVIPVVVAALAYLLFVALLQTDIPHGPIERLFS